MTNEKIPGKTTLLCRPRTDRRGPRIKVHQPPSPNNQALNRLPKTPFLERLCECQFELFQTLDNLREFAKPIKKMETITEWLVSIDQLLWEFDDLHDEFTQCKIDFRDLLERWVDEIVPALQELLDQWEFDGHDDHLLNAFCEKIHKNGYEFTDAIIDYQVK